MGLADDLNAIKDQLDKAKGEVLGKIAQLDQALAAAGEPDPGVIAAVDALKAAAQGLDDVVPDLPAEPTA